MAHVALSERRKIQLEKDRAAAEKVGISPVASEPFSYGSTGEADSPELYLVMHNIAKQRNIGNMIRSAVAFGVKELIVVSRTSSLNMPSFGAQGSRRFLNIRRFERMDEAKEWMVANGEYGYCRVMPACCLTEWKHRAEPLFSPPSSTLQGAPLPTARRHCSHRN